MAKHSALFRYIESVQGERAWGRFLDAGTGLKSIQWVLDLQTEQWTAVTGAPGDAARVRSEVKARQRPRDRIETGNWASADLLKGEVFDTVLADYLLGAVEGVSPYFQPYLFARLRPLTRGVLYTIAVEPYVPTSRPQSNSERIVWEIGRYRDACLLLTGGFPYREYPMQWVVDHIKRAGFSVQRTKRFPIRYKTRFVNTQIDLCVPLLKTLNDSSLARALLERGQALKAEALAAIEVDGALRAGHDYVIVAEPC
ncbi:MAG: class I SAM-dependent methyltransferase [Pseudomonadota bacterium]